MTEILENVKVFAQRRGRRRCRRERQQGYDNTSMFSSKTVKLKRNTQITNISDFAVQVCVSNKALFLYGTLA